MHMPANYEAEQVKVDSLLGDALSWAVVKAKGAEPILTATGIAFRASDGEELTWFKLDENECGRIQDSALIGIERPMAPGVPWRALSNFRGKPPRHQHIFAVSSTDTDRKTAIFRCFVKSLHGESVAVPKVLLE